MDWCVEQNARIDPPLDAGFINLTPLPWESQGKDWLNKSDRVIRTFERRFDRSET